MIYTLDKINEMADGDEDFITAVIGAFLEEVPIDINGLEAAIERGDHDQIYQLSHKIKPNVDILGMEDTRARALELETLGKTQGDLATIAAKFPEFKSQVEQAIAELQRDFAD